jgi:hypothetical protein
MFNTNKLFLGILPLVALSTAPVFLVQAQTTETGLVAIANKSETLKEGKFQKVKAKTSGDVSIVKAGNGRLFIEFDDDFRSEKGPDLFVIMSKSDLTSQDPAPGEVLYTVSPLLRLKGAQRYILPGNFNLEDYQSIAIWCRQQNMILGAAMLK